MWPTQNQGMVEPTQGNSPLRRLAMAITWAPNEALESEAPTTVRSNTSFPIRVRTHTPVVRAWLKVSQPISRATYTGPTSSAMSENSLESRNADPTVSLASKTHLAAWD